jgi:peroxiredoxin Q/BCP
MSKKTRKKSPKSPTEKTSRAPSRTTAKNPSSKSRDPVATKSSKSTTSRHAGTSVSRGSQKPASKALKSVSIAKSGTATVSKTKVSNSSPGKFGASAAARSVLAEGATAPSFRLPRDGGSIVSLSDFAGRKLVLFFYPRADTPGCTKEAIDFTRLSGAFAASDTAVLGVSGDPPRAQEAFRHKHQLTVPLASDETHEMLAAYGAWGEKSMYGRTFHGILRTTILIGRDGKILKIWRNVRVEGHADAVLAAAQTA